MRPPSRPEVSCLAACPHCPNRTGSYRLARLAARLGPETPLEDVLRCIAFDCPWVDEHHPPAKSQYVPKCKAHFPDIEAASPQPPDVPPGMMKLRVIQEGKA